MTLRNLVFSSYKKDWNPHWLQQDFELSSPWRHLSGVHLLISSLVVGWAGSVRGSGYSLSWGIVRNIPLVFSLLLLDKVIQRSAEYSTTPVQNECSNAHSSVYGPCSTETVMLMLGLMVLSWFKFNIKKKTENGQCHKPAHGPVTETHPANCLIGSKLYDHPRRFFKEWKIVLQHR